MLSNELEKAEKIITSVVPGVKSVSKAIKCPVELKEIKAIIAELLLEEVKKYSSFAVRVKRVGTHPFTSMELAAEVGAFILEKCSNSQLRVDLTSPEYTLYIEVREKSAYLYHEKKEGLGGLPVGCQGRVLVLLEGKKEDLAHILQMYQRGANTVICSLKSQDDFNKTHLGYIELLLDLQSKNAKQKQLIFLEKQINLIDKILSYYSLTDSKAIVMSKNLFYQFEQQIPVTIPLFVPDLAENIDFKKVEKILNIIE